METDAMITKPQPRMTHRMLPAVLPLLFIAITYVDPGKWVAAVEGGARFGYDLILLMFVFSLAAVLCHYLSACIAVVTGRDLAQICSEEYDTITCIFLGVQAELSMIALDLSMILGIAHALNLTFGIGLFTCVLLTSIDTFLFPVFSNLLETSKAKFMCMWLATVALLSYLFGVVMSQRDTSYSMGGMVTGFSGESAFALMSLLGASIMPHNFYLHSSMVQQSQGSTQVSKGDLCHDHLFAIASVFSGIFLVNYALMNSAANVFYSTGLDLLTFQDAMSLMDQVTVYLHKFSLGPPLFPVLVHKVVKDHSGNKCRGCWRHSRKSIRYDRCIDQRNPLGKILFNTQWGTSKNAPIRNNHSRFRYNPPCPKSRCGLISPQLPI